MKAIVNQNSSMHQVVMVLDNEAWQIVKSYSGKINADNHAKAINDALFNPAGLNQKPVDRVKR